MLLDPNNRFKRVLRLDIFFDGTDQNRYNDERLPDRDISNPVKLYDLYQEQTVKGVDEVTTRHIYVPGVGVATGKETAEGFQVEEDQLGLGLVRKVDKRGSDWPSIGCANT